MNDGEWVLRGAVLGIFLGVFYYWTLWAVLSLVTKGKLSPLFLPGCFVLRSAAVLFGFYALTPGGWVSLGTSILAFFLVQRASLHMAREWGCCPKSREGKQ